MGQLQNDTVTDLFLCPIFSYLGGRRLDDTLGLSSQHVTQLAEARIVVGESPALANSWLGGGVFRGGVHLNALFVKDKRDTPDRIEWPSEESLLQTIHD